MTNRERIKIMTTYELAEWLLTNKFCTPSPERCPCYDSCKDCVKDWLQQEAEK